MRPPLHIRPYHAPDRDAIIGLLTTSDPWMTLGYRASDWAGLFDDVERGLTREALVVEDAGRVVAAAVLRRQFLAGDYLEIFVVAADVRGGGIGRWLLSSCEARVFARAKNLFLSVSDFNEGARAFYRACGYEEAGRLASLLVAGRDEILMRKTTGPVR